VKAQQEVATPASAVEAVAKTGYLAPPSTMRRLVGRYGWNVGVAIEAVALLAFWEYITSGLEVLPASFLPSPSDVWAALVDLAAAGTLARHTLFTLQNFILGFALAVVIAIPIGIVMGGSDLAEMLLAPPMWALYAVPRIALAPIFVIAFGLGSASKVAVVFSMATFPILINTMQGMKSVAPVLVQVAEVYGATRVQVVRKVMLPSLLPYIFVGLRIAVAGAIAGALVGEFIGSFEGLGLLLARAAYNFDMARALAIVFIVVLLAQGLMASVQLAKRIFAPWDDSVTG
jgi:ABC-type nitrate/sulfonate/bicarbonate transport system permease component